MSPRGWLPAGDCLSKNHHEKLRKIAWLRGRDLNPRPPGYEPGELPGCSTPRPIVQNPHALSFQGALSHSVIITAMPFHVNILRDRSKNYPCNWLQPVVDNGI